MKINENLTPRQAIILGIVFNLFCYVTMFIRAIFGSARNDWGYSEFLVNYSDGFIRRGLPGTFLKVFFEVFGFDPYLFLTVILIIILILILVIFYYLLSSTKVSASTIVFLSANPLLLNAPFLSVTMFRKDWLIILGLMAHAYVARLVLFGKINSVTYIAFLVALVVYGELSILSHEITFLFIFIHLFLIINIRHCFTNFERRIIKRLYIFFFSVQLISFIYSIINHGSLEQTENIIKSVSAYTEIGSMNAILSFGNSSAQVLSGGFNFNNIINNSVNYFVWFLIGPYLIFRSLKPKYVETLFYPVLTLLPVCTLFFPLGGDWGRWLILLSFSIFVLMISDWQFINKHSNFNFYSEYACRPLSFKTVFIIVNSIFFVSLLFRVPVGNPTSIVDIWSGIFEIIYRFSFSV